MIPGDLCVTYLCSQNLDKYLNPFQHSALLFKNPDFKESSSQGI